MLSMHGGSPYYFGRIQSYMRGCICVATYAWLFSYFLLVKVQTTVKEKERCIVVSTEQCGQFLVGMGSSQRLARRT